MEFSSKLLEKAVYEMSQLPGIGKRTALRLVLHLLRQPKEQTVHLASALQHMRNDIKFCSSCHNISDTQLCEICANPRRTEDIICVVEDIRDVMAIENTSSFKGLYHVLGGKISPMDGIGPNDLNITTLVSKVKEGRVKELIFALSSTMEGDTTNFYIFKQIQDCEIVTSTIARGISVGNELEYTDEVTLGRSILNRIPFEASLKLWSFLKLSVVIVNYNVRYFLELCLKSVQAAITTLDAEILVVDNHSSDDSCLMVKQLFPKITLIQNQQNLGFSKANNIGVAQAKGDYVCILNPDTVVAEDTFIKCLAYAHSASELGILGCQLIDGRGQFLPESKRNIPTPKVSVKKIFGFDKDYYATHLASSDIGKVEVLVGAFMILKKSVYHQVNGFDEDYFMYGEDIDLSYKVLKAGYQNVYYGETTILHYKGESTSKDKVYISHFYGAMQIFYNKHFKSNPIFNTLVWMGVQWSRFLFKSPKQIKPHTSNYVVVSDHLDFNEKLPFQFQVVKHSTSVSAPAQIVFDGNVLKYKHIIADMATLDKKKSLTFRILPANTQFIIGSDSSEQRGEVLLFP